MAAALDAVPLTSPPPVRQVPTPQWEPPYDEPDAADDRGPRGLRVLGSTGRDGVTGVQGTLALTFVLPSGLPTTPAPPLRLVPTPATEHDVDAARVWASRFVQAVLEVRAGDRPVAQLLRWTSGRVYEDLQRWVTANARRCPPSRTGAARAVLRSVRAMAPAEGVAEVTAVAQRGDRVVAVALRAEHRRGRWVCTALEVG